MGATVGSSARVTADPSPMQANRKWHASDHVRQNTMDDRSIRPSKRQPRIAVADRERTTDEMDTTKARDVLGKQFDFIFEDASRLIQHLGLSKSAKILDVGTGMGYFAITLALNGYSVLTGEPASDDSIYAQKDWRKSAREIGVDHLIQFRSFEAQDMPFDDATFDAIFFFGVLHHVDEIARTKVLREAFRTVKPGASISFVEPNQECMKIVMARNPSHPDPADPIAYAHGLAISQQTVRGRYFNSTIFRMDSD